MNLSHHQRLARRWLNRSTTTACDLKGANAFAWKPDLLAVGGMEERLYSGGLDRELGVRLQSHGIRARHIRYNAVCLHLDYSRGYRSKASVDAIRAHRLHIERTGVDHTSHGTGSLLNNAYPGSMHSIST